MRLVAVIVLAVGMIAPSLGDAQRVQTFAELPLRINTDDRVRVTDAAGAKVLGRVHRFGRDGLVLATNAGERTLAPGDVRGLDVRGPSTKRGALVGAGVFAVLGAVACSQNEKSGCWSWPVLDAVFFGAPLGLLVGSWIPSMRPVYAAGASPAGQPRDRATVGTGPSLRESLGMRVNQGDRLAVLNSSGVEMLGSLRALDDDALTLGGPTGLETVFTRETLRRVALARGHGRRGAWIGFLVGAGSGAAFSCTGDDTAECPDAIIMLGGMGAGAGAIIGAISRTEHVVYPVKEQSLSVAPMLQRERVGVRVSYRF